MQSVDGVKGEEATAPLRRLGRYELIAQLARGGMAEVFLARLTGPMNFQKLVVVKTIHPDLASEEQFLHMLLDEARLSALIKHPRVVDIYELGEVEGRYFIAMEYIEGQPFSLLMSAGFKGRGLEPNEVARVIADAAEGLHAAHELKTMSGKAVELVHRDVSPANIMVLYDGTVKIVDFGVAKARGRLTNSAMKQLKGKIGYVSPEQISGDHVDRRSDIFSLGVCLWEGLALRKLFAGDGLEATVERGHPVPPPSQFRPQVPPPFDEICLKALAQEPSQRYQKAGDLKNALEAALRDLGNHRETEAVAQYMNRLFGRRRAEHSQLLRKRARTSGEQAIFELPTPSVSSTATVSPRRRRLKIGLLIGGLAVAAMAAGGVVARQSTTLPPALVAAPPAPVPVAPPVLTPVVIPPVAVPAPPEPAPPSTPHVEKAERPDPPKATSASAAYNEGAKLFVKGDHAKAKAKFKEALDIDSRYAPAHRGLGLVYQAMGKNARAIASFKTYLKLASGAPDAASIKARIEALE